MSKHREIVNFYLIHKFIYFISAKMLRGTIFNLLKTTSGYQTNRMFRRRAKPSAGIAHQNKVINDINEFVDDPELNLEADFNKLSYSHRQHEEELRLRHEQKRLFVVKNKYFKTEKMPNLLTWSEKEQIRHLHKSRPDEWTIEKLTESFPATEEIIMKIVKAKWAPFDMNRIQKHDESVKQNWQMLKSNKLPNLDPELCEHLKKFSNRRFDSTNNAYAQTENDQTKFTFPVPKSKEFVSIITSCKAYADKPQAQIDSSSKSNELLEDNSATKEEPMKINVPRKLKKRQLTLDELKQNFEGLNKQEDEEHLTFTTSKQTQSQKTISTHKQLDKEQKQDVSQLSTTKIKQKIDDDSDTIDLTASDVDIYGKIQKYQTKEVAVNNLNKEQESSEIRLKIEIPKRLQRKGKVYKLYDCFYDDQGLFLYRVPGLSN